MICIGRVVVIDAKINELVLHLIYNLPACILILFLKVLCIGFYFTIKKTRKIQLIRCMDEKT